jgi:hypothetical protein
VGRGTLVVHLTGVAILLVTIVVVDLRLLGIARSFPVRRLAAWLLPFSAASFLIIVPSGLALFLARASELIGDPVFALKMSLVFAAGINAAVFHAGVFRSSEHWNTMTMPPPAARAAAALSLMLWSSVVACGLWLAKDG